MSRLPESLPAYLQKHFGICRRTFERWCARGDVPGAYRTRGGHWRVRKHTNAMFESMMHHRTKTRRDEVRNAIVFCPRYPSKILREVLDGTLQPRIAEAKFTLAAHGITEADIRDKKLKERDPEKYNFLWKTSPPIRHPRAHEAVKERPLHTAAYLLRRYNGMKITREAVARDLGVSVNTLYRRYGQRAVRVACEEPVSLPPPSRPRS
jgi:hypothetical protein